MCRVFERYDMEVVDEDEDEDKEAANQETTDGDFSVLGDLLDDDDDDDEMGSAAKNVFGGGAVGVPRDMLQAGGPALHELPKLRPEVRPTATGSRTSSSLRINSRMRLTSYAPNTLTDEQLAKQDNLLEKIAQKKKEFAKEFVLLPSFEVGAAAAQWAKQKWHTWAQQEEEDQIAQTRPPGDAKEEKTEEQSSVPSQKTVTFPELVEEYHFDPIAAGGRERGEDGGAVLVPYKKKEDASRREKKKKKEKKPFQEGPWECLGPADSKGFSEWGKTVTRCGLQGQEVMEVPDGMWPEEYMRTYDGRRSRRWSRSRTTL
jgi:hypothetical protein